jgi:hypothetical protein
MPFTKSFISANDVKDSDNLQRTLNGLQQNIGTAINSIDKSLLQNGVLISDVSLNGSIAINHKLARMPLGYFVVAKSSNVNIWDTAKTVDTLTLNSSGSTTISIYVF